MKTPDKWLVAALAALLMVLIALVNITWLAVVLGGVLGLTVGWLVGEDHTGDLFWGIMGRTSFVALMVVLILSLAAGG